MAITHHFIDESDLSAGGIWSDDYGREICRWSWNPQTKVLTVDVSTSGHTFNYGEQNFTTEKLRQRSLPQIAISAAEDLNKRKYRN